jgi:hypothetical protein
VRSVSGCLVNDRSTIRSDAARSIDAVGANCRAARLGKNERSKRDHDGERNAFHFNSNDL